LAENPATIVVYGLQFKPPKPVTTGLSPRPTWLSAMLAIFARSSGLLALFDASLGDAVLGDEVLGDAVLGDAVSGAAFDVPLDESVDDVLEPELDESVVLLGADVLAAWPVDAESAVADVLAEVDVLAGLEAGLPDVWPESTANAGCASANDATTATGSSHLAHRRRSGGASPCRDSVGRDPME
jgi:hypothetical protein